MSIKRQSIIYFFLAIKFCEFFIGGDGAFAPICCVPEWSEADLKSVGLNRLQCSIHCRSVSCRSKRKCLTELFGNRTCAIGVLVKGLCTWVALEKHEKAKFVLMVLPN